MGVAVVEESIQPVAEDVVQRAVKPSVQTTPQLGLLESQVGYVVRLVLVLLASSNYR